VTAAEQIDKSQPMRPKADDAVSQMVTLLSDHWRLTDSDRVALLGRSVRPTTFDKSVASNESAERIGHLLVIHARLRILFPQNRDVAYGWMSAPNRAFNGRTPVEAVREHRLDGLRAVRAYLEHAIGA
jgi:hypothetical protein